MPAPLPTTWSKKSAPAATVLLEGPFFLQKQDSNFYIFRRGVTVNRVEPTKQNSNFYFLSGSYEASYRMGKEENNFMLIDPRT